MVDSPGRIYSHPIFIADGEQFLVIEWERGKGPRRITRLTGTGEKVAESLSFADHPEGIGPSADGKLLACRTREVIRVYPTAGGLGHPPTIRNDTLKHFTAVAFHPSGRYLAATSNDATVKLYDTATWQLSQTFTWDVGRLRSVAFSPDGTLAAVGSDTGKVVVWDVDV